MFWIFAITVAPAGASGTLPLLPDPLVGVGVVEPEPELPVEEEAVEVEPLEVPDDVPDDDPAVFVDDPDELEDEDDDDPEDGDDEPEELDEPEAMAALVVLAVVVAVFGLEHPVTAKTANMNVPTAQNPFRLSCIGTFPPVGGRQSGQIR